MPADSGMAFVLIQHLDPEHKSEMAGLLARQTSMRVVEASHGQEIEANCVYVIPPNQALAIRKGRLHLSVPTEARGRRLLIDFFFRSLAAEYVECSIGIVFSGTGSDGTLGLREIQGVGGLTIAQNPKSAEFDGMPQSAIGSGAVDCVLDIEQMPEVLGRYAEHPYVRAAADPEEPHRESGNEFSAIIELIAAQTKFNFASYKRGTLGRRIERRMSLRHLTKVQRYVQVLRHDPKEVRALVKDLLICVTQFFRDPEAWKVLQELVIRPLVQRKGNNETIRVWVPGCATGEEAYTLGMILLDELAAANKTCRIQMFASDVNCEAFAMARLGIYPESLVATISPQRLRRYFVPDGERYRVRPELRDALVFAEQNLLEDPPFSRLDLISCRNLLIYLEPQAQRRVLSLFRYALRGDGHIFLGNAETVSEPSGMFTEVSRKWRIYRRSGPSRPEPQELPLVHGQSHVPRIAAEATATPAARFNEMAQQLVLDRCAPACVVINRKLEILFTCGPINDYLRQPHGRMRTNLLPWVADSLRPRLRAALKSALGEGAGRSVTEGRPVRVKSAEAVSILVEPLKTPQLAEGLLLVTFRAAGPAARSTKDGAEAGEVEDESLVQQLEDELKTTREDLQSSIDQLETANEELNASNEEATSVNEELQSANEELETSKEELQSLNEELSTVNSQLQVKVEELEEKSNDLNNLLSSTEIATLFLDHQFNVKWFTPPTTRLLRLLPTDIGRPISDFSQKYTGGDLLQDGQEVLRKLTPLEKEIRGHDGRWYLRRVLPYRATEKRIEGVVVTFVDIHRTKTAEEGVRWLATVLKDSNDAVTLKDFQRRILAWNSGAQKMYGYTEKDALAMQATRFIPRAKRAEMEALIERLKGGENITTPLETQRIRRDGRVMDVLLTATALLDETGKPIGIATTERDITQHKKDETDLRLLNQTLEKRVRERTRLAEHQARRLRELAAQLLATEEQERRKLAVDLHDTLAQLLHVAKMKLSDLRPRGGETQNRLLQQVRKLLDDANQAVRSMSYQLSPPILYELGLAPALQWLGEEMKHLYNLEVTIKDDSCAPDLNESTRTILFRAIRELLINVAKHSGARSAVVWIRRHDHTISVVIEDQGVGFDPKAVLDSRRNRGLGLFSIRERLDYLGGKMEIHSVPKKKTTIVLTLPLAAVHTPDSGGASP